MRAGVMFSFGRAGSRTGSRPAGKSLGLLLSWKPFHPADVETLSAMVMSGAIQPRIDRTFPLDGAVEALTYVAEGHNRGKVLIKP